MQRATRSRLLTLGPLLALALGGPAQAGAAAGLVALAPPGDAAWEPLHFPRIDRHTRYAAAAVDGRAAWRANSDCSSSALVIGLEGLDFRATPILSWWWRAERLPAVSNERSRDGDDFAARVYVIFPLSEQQQANLSLFERMRRGLGARLYGREMPGASLNYVWASNAARGDAWPNPYDAANQMLALRSARDPLRTWAQERVDVERDYQNHIGRRGRPVPAPLAIALMSDSDDGCSAAAAAFGALTLEARSPAGAAAAP